MWLLIFQEIKYFHWTFLSIGTARKLISFAASKSKQICKVGLNSSIQQKQCWDDNSFVLLLLTCGEINSSHSEMMASWVPIRFSGSLHY